MKFILPFIKPINFGIRHTLIRNFIALLFLLAFNLFIQDSKAQNTLGLLRSEVKQIENGYILFAPMYCKTTYLIDRCGNKVNSWTSNYAPGYSAYLLPDGSLLRTGTVNDGHFPFSGKGGIIEKYNWEGQLIWSYLISNDSLAQHHDIKPMDNGNILVIAWHKIETPVADASGRLPGTLGGSFLASERIIEIQPIGTNDAKVVWQWSLWDHLVQDTDPSKPNFNRIEEHPELVNVNYAPGFPDWIHCNAIDYNKELDQIILSNHRMHEFWIIDHSTTTAEATSHKGGKYNKGGDLLYRWGNPNAYNSGTPLDQQLFDQHNVHWIKKGLKDGGSILFYNNGTGREPKFSSVDVVDLPITVSGFYEQTLDKIPRKARWSYTDPIPERFFSVNLSGAQRLSNGNTLITIGVQGKFFEINQQKDIVWEYQNPVSLGDTIQVDGQIANKNKVFKCIFYPKDYSAFAGRKILSNSPIELQPKAFNCGKLKKKKKRRK